MELSEALLKRRSIRKFKGEAVPDELIEELLHAGMSGPSACNKQPWEFYVVTNPEILDKLRTVTRFTNMNGSLAVIVCGNLSRALASQLAPFWIQDCSAATENILLRATDLGLGAVWCGIHPKKRAEQKVAEILNLDEKKVPLNIIWLGYPAEEAEPKDRYNEARVHYIK